MGRSPGLAGRRLARVIGPARSRPDKAIFCAGAGKTQARTPARGKTALTRIGNRGYPEPMKAAAGRSGLISPTLFNIILDQNFLFLIKQKWSVHEENHD